ncbi:hypothetical protein SAMN02745781_01478 [Vibrio gazogenes DSM 21264]|uniref:Uncharacterized protein n=1 Tax=Vibrio gazogenes DSM 21264 = NBRC 103151 TaxID=1123492 RepID=A0A1M4YXA3_VIBGA|nr:hypothetical protein SAMN02745781_01478 [Vibrio gazogenes DSM 21264] [Vibrio gazogenes DSM 21264 = NBRC 103151]SJN58362.1 hypothetical protein BQ6471_02988 [Vibrio gazogenes]
MHTKNPVNQLITGFFMLKIFSDEIYGAVYLVSRWHLMRMICKDCAAI